MVPQQTWVLDDFWRKTETADEAHAVRARIRSDNPELMRGAMGLNLYWRDPLVPQVAWLQNLCNSVRTPLQLPPPRPQSSRRRKLEHAFDAVVKAPTKKARSKHPSIVASPRLTRSWSEEPLIPEDARATEWINYATGV
jgi:hypothetical protein